MPDFKVVDGSGSEATVSVPDGYAVLSNDDLDSKYIDRSLTRGEDSVYVTRASFDKRFRDWIPSSTAHENDDVIKRVKATLPKGDKAPDFDIDTAKANWRKEEVDPLKGELNSLYESVTSSKISEASANLFDEKFTKKGPRGKSWVDNEFGGVLRYDPESKQVLAFNGDNPIQSLNPTRENPYMTANEFLATQAKRPEYADFLPPDPKGGGGTGRPGNQGNGVLGKDANPLDILKKDGLDALYKSMGIQ